MLNRSLIPFNVASSICISGPTGSGKSIWVYNFFKNINALFNGESPKDVLYCYGVWQPLFEEIEKKITFINFHEGLPSKDDIESFSKNTYHKLIILDDLMEDVLNSHDMLMLFIRGCHHKNISCIFITQNIFSQSKHSKTIALNTQYLVLFRNFRDSSQIITLGKQIFPGKVKSFQESYNDATTKKYGYLLVDLSPHTEDMYRLRTLVMPGEDTVIYVRKV